MTGPRAGQNAASDYLDDLGDDGVAEGAQSVHPGGNPMSHSTHVGFSGPPTVFGSWSPLEGGRLARLGPSGLFGWR